MILNLKLCNSILQKNNLKLFTSSTVTLCFSKSALLNFSPFNFVCLFETDNCADIKSCFWLRFLLLWPAEGRDDADERRIRAGHQADRCENHQSNVFPHNPVARAELVGPQHADLHDGGKSESEDAQAKSAKQADEQAELGNGCGHQESKDCRHQAQQQLILGALRWISDLFADIILPNYRYRNVALQSIRNENCKSKNDASQIGKPKRSLIFNKI